MRSSADINEVLSWEKGFRQETLFYFTVFVTLVGSFLRKHLVKIMKLTCHYITTYNK